jgi:hypothetical protein
MDCEHSYVALQAAVQAGSPAYDRIEVILTAIAVIVAVLVGVFTIASVLLAFGAFFGWREMIDKAKEAASAAAKSQAKETAEEEAKLTREEAKQIAREEGQKEARKWADIYSDPSRMFEALGVKPTVAAHTPAPPDPLAPGSPSDATKIPVGEQLVAAMSEEPLKITLPGKEEPNVIHTEVESEPKPGPRPDTDETEQ